MKVDVYTKSVLTVIAVCLIVLTLHQIDLVHKAYAAGPYNMYELPGGDFGLVPLNEDGSITVRLNTSDKIDVNIVGVNTNDELDVNIDEIGGGWVSHGGPIKVEVE
ncbi:MAG: hypothetical protein ACE5FF_04775 [Saprospiraceae bacterium]